MALSMDLDEAVVLVTGGVRGVGAGVVRAFLRSGARVVTCARNAPDAPVTANGATAEFVACDVRDAEQVGRLVLDVTSRYGRLDVVVNNAGGTPFVEASQASARFHEKVIGLNLLAPLLVSQQANAVMTEQESGGVIVNISSVSGTRPSPGTAAYGAAKAGLDNLTSSLAVEWAPRVRVNAIDVGMVRTERSEQHYGDAHGVASVGSTVPLGRLAEPEEIGNCAVFLASPLASYVSGATLAVHGGGERPAFLDAAQTQVSEKQDRERA